MNEIIEILIERDDLTEKEATDLFNDGKREISEAISNGDYEEVEELMSDWFGLEMDYLFCLV